MTHILIDDLYNLENFEFLINDSDISLVENLWNSSDENLEELRKIDFCKNIKTWKDVDQDLYRLILLNVFVNYSNNDELLKYIIKLMIYSAQHLLKSKMVSVKIVVIDNSDILIDYTMCMSTIKDAEKRKQKGCKSSLKLVIDNTKE